MKCCSQDRREAPFPPRRNWVIVILLRSVSCVAYVITFPSMHQFVTNPANSDVQDSSHEGAWPGLGQSEFFYSWAATIFSFGETTGALVAGGFTRCVPYRLSFLMDLSLCVVGYLLYFLTNEHRVWMILVARFIIGFHVGGTIVLVYAYIGETAPEEPADQPQLDSNHHSKVGICRNPPKTLKDKLFVFNSFVITITYMAIPGLCSLAALLPSIDPYRWGAWFEIAFATVYMIFFIVVYKEWKPRKQPSGKCSRFFKCGGWSGSVKDTLVYSFLVACACVNGSCYTVLDTLLNPILSDHFGFTVADNSYFMFGVLVVQFGGSILLLVVQQLGINSRKRFILGLSMLIVGAVIVSDWQSIGHDPCLTVTPRTNNLSSTLFSTSKNNSTSLWNNKATLDGNYSSFPEDYYLSNDSVGELLLKANYCMTQSSEENTCHWNPLSLVTGKLCEECYPVCRSIQKSLNFIQLLIGIMLFTTAVPMSSVTLFLIASEFTPLEKQGTVVGVLTAAGGLARIFSPLWSALVLVAVGLFHTASVPFHTDALYEATEKHTYPVMSVMFLIVATMLCLFYVLYNSLAPRPVTSSNNNDVSLEELNIVSNKGSEPDNPPKKQPVEQLTEIHQSYIEEDTSLSTIETSLLLTEGQTIAMKALEEEEMCHEASNEQDKLVLLVE